MTIQWFGTLGALLYFQSVGGGVSRSGPGPAGPPEGYCCIFNLGGGPLIIQLGKLTVNLAMNQHSNSPLNCDTKLTL